MKRITFTMDERGYIHRICADEEVEVYIVCPHVPRDPVYRWNSCRSGRSMWTRSRLRAFAPLHPSPGGANRLTAELVALGFPPARAAMLALGFTDVGEGGAGWGDEKVEIGRLTGQLYKTGYTVLVAHPAEDAPDISNVDAKTPLMEVFYRPSRRAAATVVLVNSVVARVCAALDLEYPA